MASSSLRLRDLRGIFELTGRCRELGEDSPVWREAWLQGLAELVGADLIVGGELGGMRSGVMRSVGLTEWGWENGFDRAGWLRSLELFAVNPFYSALMREYSGRVRQTDGIALTGSELVPENEWVRELDYQEAYRPIGVHHNLWCFRSIPGRPDEMLGHIIGRAEGRRDYVAREKAIVAEAYRVIVPLVGGPLAPFGEPAPSALPPRVRQVLRCLLEGDSDKQIAARLRISKYTVNEYVKQAFRHFGVLSRSELLARWVRRGWGNGFAWEQFTES